MKSTKPTKKLTKAQKRVAVAKDVLKLLKFIIPRRGVYIDANVSLVGVTRDSDMRDHVKQIRTNCECCPLGAMLLSKAGLFNNVPLNTYIWQERDDNDDNDWITGSRDSIVRSLSDIFDADQLLLIETAFEGFWNASVCGSELAGEYRYHYENNADCLRAIMKNIIANDGKFIPEAL